MKQAIECLVVDPSSFLRSCTARCCFPACVKVYSIDLVGFGASDKPVQQYTIELWAELVDDFLAEFCSGTPAVVVGNSIGSLVVLTAAAKAAAGQLAGVVLLNCAGAMNNKVCLCTAAAVGWVG